MIDDPSAIAALFACVFGLFFLGERLGILGRGRRRK
jgi:hypothetical protein